MNEVKFLITSDTSISIVFGDKISDEINRRVNALALSLKKLEISGIIEFCPSYSSLMVSYDPAIISFKKLERKIRKLVKKGLSKESEDSILWEIPVCYGGKYGEDLINTAQLLRVCPEELIERHSGVVYKIYMLGFLPGFAYLGGLDSSIAAPRLSSPRKKIPVGSVGIGGQQTGIYPMSSPGGWRLIGTTPIDVYNINRENPILYSAGDYLKFISVSEKEFENIKLQTENGTYTYKSSKWGGEND